MIHRLTEKNTEKRTAVCSVDGEVRIYRAGRGWVCSVKHRALTAGNRGSVSDGANQHRLVDRDEASRTAVCSVCGPSPVQPWGRGWLCSTRAAELGRTAEQDAPQLPCRDCLDDDGTWINLVDGWCERCAKSLNLQLLELAATERELADADIDAMSFSIVGQWADPYKMPDDETAVPGWRTLGSRTEVVTAV